MLNERLAGMVLEAVEREVRAALGRRGVQKREQKEGAGIRTDFKEFHSADPSLAPRSAGLGSAECDRVSTAGAVGGRGGRG